LRALLVLSLNQAKSLVAKAIAKKLKDEKKRVYVAYGSTNELILKELGIEKENYYNGYIDKNFLLSNQNRPNITILNGKIDNFLDTICPDDIVIKGANALSFEDGEYKAGVAVASESGGTYGSVILRASCVGAKVIIPVTHEKLVPKLYANCFSQNDFDLSMGLGITLFALNYGEVYTEIDAFKELYDLDAKLYLAGGLNEMSGALSFVVDGEEASILKIKNELVDDR